MSSNSENGGSEPAYLVSAINIENRKDYQDYVNAAVASFQAMGGEALAICDEPIELEGSSPGGRIVLLKFPSKEALQAWFDSDAYQAARPLRLATASTPFLLSVSGVKHKVD